MLNARGFIADRGDARLRLDQAIVRRLTDVPRLSRTRVQRWIDDRQVRVNDVPAKRASTIVAAGDRIDIFAQDALELRRAPQPEPGALDILYEDEHMLALNKPPGVVVHPAYKNQTGTLLNTLLAHTAGARLVHRLDKDTSGVLLAAKSSEMNAVLQRALAQDRARKIYLAVVEGRPGKARGTIGLPLGVDPGDRRRVIVCESGRPSTTRYEVLKRGKLSVVKCELLTGRMHQIRVHLAAAGWPVAGDMVYGQASGQIARQALHAWRLTFSHPVSGEATEVVAPPPPDLVRLFDTQNFTL